MATLGEKEREEPAYNTKTKGAKLERLRSVILICHDLKATNYRHAKTLNEITDSSLIATINNYF
jgi:hypothetical protein